MILLSGGKGKNLFRLYSFRLIIYYFFSGFINFVADRILLLENVL